MFYPFCLKHRSSFVAIETRQRWFPGLCFSYQLFNGNLCRNFLIIINTVVLLLNFLIVGKTAGAKGVYGYVFLSFLIDMSRKLLNLQQLASSGFLSGALL